MRKVSGAEQDHSLSKALSYTQLSTITTWMGDNYMLSFAPYLGSLQSNSLQTLQKFLWRRLCVEVPCVYTYIMQKTTCAYPIVHVKVP